MLEVPYSTLRMWLLRHKISVVTGATGMVRITDKGLEELRNIALVKQQIHEIEELRFKKKQ